MGKRYYCDYCDRSFTDEISSRKKHLSSVNHKQAKKQHYLRCRDLRDLVQEERAKGTCKRFFLGKCPYNENCIYSHYSQEQLEQFSEQVENYEKERARSFIRNVSIKEWLHRQSMKKSGMTLPEEQSVSSAMELSGGDHLKDLPPSLKLIDGYTLRNVELTEWG